MRIAHTDINLVQGDITRQEVDVIVNAANEALAGGGGVDGAIHRAGGPSIMQETRQKYPGGCPTGSAVITGAGDLAAHWVIHTVGPVWQGGTAGEAEKLSSAYESCLGLAEEAGAVSIAFPSISTGVYGYPVQHAARVALETVRQYLEEKPDTSIREVRFVLFDPTTFKAFQNQAEQ